MAIGTPRSFGGATFGSNVTTSTSTPDTPLANERIFVFATSRATAAYQADCTITNSGTALTWTKFATNIHGPATNPFLNGCAFWADATPMVGTSMTITCTGVGTVCEAVAVTMAANPDTTNLLTPTGTTSVATGSLSGTPAAALCLALANGGGTMTQNGSYNILHNTSSGVGRLTAWYDLTTPATSFTITSPGTNTIAVFFELKESAGGTTASGALATGGTSTAAFASQSTAAATLSTGGSSTVAFTSYAPLSVGVNMTALEYAWQVSPTTFNWDYVKSRGFQTVRIPVAWERLQPTLGGALDATFLAQYTAAVNQALSRGMNVLIDVHNYGTWDPLFDPIAGSPPGTYNHGSPGQSGSYKLGSANLTQAHFVDLWTRLATAFAGTPGIAYGLMNEPHDLFATNLVASSNHFTNTKGAQAWFTGNSAVLTPRQATSLSGFNDAWTMTDGGNFGFVAQGGVVFGAGAHTFSVEVSTASGSVACSIAVDFANALSFTATTTKQRFSKSFTPGAGTHTISIQANTNTGAVVRIANAQVNAGAGTTYTGDVWPQAAQAAINAIRTVDAFTPIFVPGDNFSRTEDWLIANVNLVDMVDPSNRLTFDGHTYFDGAGGVYSSSYDTIVAGDAYGSGATRGTNFVQPLVTFSTTYGKRIFVSEVSVPNDDARWGSVMTGFQTTLGTTQVRSTFWEYITHKPTDPSFITDTGKLNIGRDNGTDAPQLAFLQPLTGATGVLTVNGSTLVAFAGATGKVGGLATGGVTTAAFVGQSALAANGVLNTSGSSTATFASASAVQGVLATGGTSTATFASASAAQGVLQSNGLSTSSFVGQSATAANGVLNTGGTSTSAFVGSSGVATTNAVFAMGGSTTLSLVSPAAPFALASMYMNFAEDVYVGAQLSDLTVVRAQTVTSYADNSAGMWLPFAANTPRKTDKGLLVEEARTNQVPNNSMQGASAGTPGSIPTGWSTTLNGLTRQVIGTGTQNGVEYIDIKFSGTATGSNVIVYVMPGASTPSNAGEFWVSSMFLALVGGSYANVNSMQILDDEFDVSFGYLRSASINLPLPSSTLARASTGAITLGASTKWTSTYVLFQITNGTAIDFTLRIGWPQWEKVNAVTQTASSPIRTTTAGVTRPKDDVRNTGASFASWYTGGTAGGTGYCEFIAPPVNGGNQFVIDFSQSGSISDENGFFIGSTRSSSTITNVGNTTQAQIFSAGIIGTVGSVVRQASTWAKDDFRYWSNGAQIPPSDISGTVPSVNQLAIGQRSDSTFIFNGFIRCIAYMPVTATQFQLYSITLLPNVLPGAIFDWDFDSSAYYGLPLTALSFTRATVGWAPNAAGDLIPFGAGVPRITDLGLWVEEARTNQIRNNTMQGAIAGTVGSGGSLPTNWGTFTTATGITVTSSLQGIEGNIEYIDIRFQGTPSASTTMQLFPEVSNQVTIPTSTIQTWINAWYLKIVGGALTNVSSWTAGLDENTSAGGFVANKTAAIVAPGSTGALGLNRQYGILTTSGGPTVARLQPWVRFSMTSGQAIDITIRVGLPCFEQGAFLQTAIKTISAAVTRNTDVPNVTGANFYNVFNTLAGGMYVEGVPQFGSAASRRMIDVNDGSSSNRLLLAQSSTANTGRGLVTTGGSAVADMFTTTLTGLVNNKLAMAYQQDNYTTLINNGSGVSDALGNMPSLGTLAAPTTGQISIGIDHAGTAGSANGGPIRRIALYAFRPSTPQLGQITTVGTLGVFGSAGSSSGSFNGSGAAPSSGVFTITGSTTVAFAGQGAAASVLSANGLSTASFVGQVASGSNSVLNASGSSTATFTGSALKPAVLAANGTTTATFSGQAAAASSFAISGVTSLAFVGQGLTVATGVLSTSGTGTAAFSSSALAPTVLNATGLSTASFVGQSVAGANAVLSTSGSSTATFVSSALKPSVLSALGLSTASFVGQGLIAANGVLNTSGTGTATFLTSVLAPSVLVTGGTTTVSFFTGAAQAASFAISGSTVAAFTGASNRASVLQANGLTTSAFASAISIGANGVINPAGTSTASFFSSATKPAVLSSGGSTTANFSATSTAQSRVNATGSTTIAFVGSSVRNLTAAQHMQFGQTATLTGSSLDGPPIWLEGSIGADDILTGSIDGDTIYGDIAEFELEGEV